MRTINGVEVLTTIEELVDPPRTAVLVIDMQNEIVSERGGYARAGTDVSPVAAIVPPIQRLLAAARGRGVLVTYAEFVMRNELGVTLMDGPGLYHLRHAAFTSDVVAGTWEARTVDALAPQQGDVVIRKSRGSAMYRTPLGDLLRARGIRSLVLTGAITEGCVLRTAVDAQQRGYYAVVLRDCVGSYDVVGSGDGGGHDRALAWMETRFPVFDAAEVIAAWQGQGS